MDPSGKAEIEFLLEYEKNSMAIEIFYWKIKVSSLKSSSLWFFWEISKYLLVYLWFDDLLKIRTVFDGWQKKDPSTK